MTDKQYHLNDNPSFCMLGLLHTYISPDGNVMPCCIGDITKESLGNINDISTWDEIWNGERYKEFRRNMVSGNKNPICSGCYDTEKFSEMSSRKWNNEQYKHYFKEYMDYLLPDGSMSKSKMKYLDFRFTNNCNQACITCGHTLSSKWYDTMVKLNKTPLQPKFIEPTNESLAYELIDSNISSVDNIYFAGGEPLLSKYHWYTLEKLIESGRAKEIDIVYSSNCSVLTYHGKNVLDYWKEFKGVMIMASIDEVGERFNYIRWPGNWDKVSENLRIISHFFSSLPNSQNFKLCFAPVISSLNAHRLKDMMQEFVNSGVYQQENHYNSNFEFLLFCNLLRTPKHLSIINATEQHWQHIDNSLNDFEAWYLNYISDSPKFDEKKELFVRGVQKIRDMRKMRGEVFEFFQYDGDDYLLHMEEYSKLDQIRGTDFRKTFPELEWLYK